MITSEWQRFFKIKYGNIKEIFHDSYLARVIDKISSFYTCTYKLPKQVQFVLNYYLNFAVFLNCCFNSEGLKKYKFLHIRVE